MIRSESNGCPILVGESNPYSEKYAGKISPEFDLYPYPAGSAGWRLCYRILNLTASDYLRRFERRNLCRGPWRITEAQAAVPIIAREAAGRTLVLLGVKVCKAFEVKYSPFSVLNEGAASNIVVLPHPSGLCRIWNEPGSIERARATLSQVGAL